MEAEKKNPPMAAKVADTIDTHAPTVELYREFAKYCLASAFNFSSLAVYQGVSSSKQDDHWFESLQGLRLRNGRVSGSFPIKGLLESDDEDAQVADV